MTIKEIEERTGMDRANIRFYEKEGLINPTRLDNGYRDYTQKDIDVLLRIKLLRSLHLSIEDIRALQTGEITLENALGSHLAVLQAEKAAVSAAEDVCRAMQTDRAVYSSLNAKKRIRGAAFWRELWTMTCICSPWSYSAVWCCISTQTRQKVRSPRRYPAFWLIP